MRQTSAMAWALAAWLVAGATPQAIAQNAGKNAPPISPQQQNAIRANCRPDFTAKCPGMMSGSKDALACLQKNVASLAPACRKVVGSTLPAVAAKPEPPAAPAPAATPPPAAPVAEPPPAAPSAAKPGQSTVRSAPPPRATLSSRSGVPQTPPPQPQPPAPPASSATPAAPPAAKQAAAPTAAAALQSPPRGAATPAAMPAAVGRTCQRDLSLYCRGRGPTDAQKIACLTSRGTRLAPACKTALKAAGAMR